MNKLILLAALILCSCASSKLGQKTPHMELDGSSWIVENVKGADIPRRLVLTANFLSYWVSGNAGCNTYKANMEPVFDGLSISAPIATRMACASEAMEWESRYLSSLQQAHYFRRKGRSLILYDSLDQPLIRFIQDNSALAYRCLDGTRLSARVSAGAAVVELTGKKLNLDRVISASGEKYESSGTSFWIKGREATLNMNEKVLRCEQY